MSWRRMPPTGRWPRPKTVPPTPTPVVVLDEDDDDDGADVSEVFIIKDAADIARAKAACNSKKGNSFGSNVINLDDDEEDGDGGGDRAGPSAAGAGSPGATTPPGHAAPRNRYGLNYVSDSEQSDLSGGSDSDSDSDGHGSSDCEILSSVAARRLWEKAASRKMIPHDPPQRKDRRASTSASSAESSTHHDENLDDLFAPGPPLDDNFWESFIYEYNTAGPSSTNGSRYDTGPSVPGAHKSPMDDVSNGKETDDRNPACTLDPDMACNGEATHSHRGPVPEKAPETSHTPHPDETLNPEGYAGFSFVSKNRVFPASSADWEDNSRMFVSTPERMDEKIPEGTSLAKNKLHAHNEITKQKEKVCFAPDDDSGMDQFTEDPVSVSAHGCFSQSGEFSDKAFPRNVTLGTCSLPLKDLVDDPEILGQSAVVPDGPDFQGGLIGDRERHKESDEYKRAAEEEWASRQRQLAIQAEEAKEAKRLRKRKKAEALRLLDMERRQKQRLEEVRETQRKGQEDIQMKEQCRGAVRLELENMERACTDVKSILRALGIPVEGGEVKAAYKKALLKFHPDRVSRTDIYQQVKAEETFKFISRFKEKLRL